MQFRSMVCPKKFRLYLILLAVFILLSARLYGQDSIADINLEDLQQVLPVAERFEYVEGELPVYRAYGDVDGEEQAVGYVFFTPDLPPEEIGYSAPIDMLVGLDSKGTVIDWLPIYYRESYMSIRGDFINSERFPDQFRNKSISEGFRVGRDVDGISRATITSWAVARGIRNAARRVALAYLPDSEYAASTNSDALALAYLRDLSWEDMEAMGLIRYLDMTQPDGTTLELTFIFMGHDGLGEILVGIDDYSRADREASNRVEAGRLLLVGIDGNATSPFRQERLGVEQDGELRAVERRRFVYAGSADYGKIAGRVRFAGAMALDDQVDITRPFKLHYATADQFGNVSGTASIEYKVPDVPLALATGGPLPAELTVPEDGDFVSGADRGTWANLVESAPWPAVFMLGLLMVLVMGSFLTKSAMLRWGTLAVTLGYLGWYDGGFLSVSHITNGIKQGPAMFMTDLPTVMILLFTIITTLLWGRLFCSSLCPFGALQDFISNFLPRHFQKELPAAIHDKAIYLKYGILVFLIVSALVWAEVSLFQYFEPFGTIFYFSQSIILWVILALMLIGTVYINRFYCRYLCPLGAALGVMTVLTPWRIKRVPQCEVCTHCQHNCPTGAIRMEKIDFKECVRCDICEQKLIARSGVCKHTVEDVRSRLTEWVPVTVS